MEHEKKIIFSATQPSGKITLGNYFGGFAQLGYLAGGL